MFSIIDTISVKLLIIPSPYPVSTTALHLYFYTYLICLNKYFSILHCKMSITLCKLETMFAVEFLEKESISDYPMIIAEVFENMFELGNTNVKLKILNN